MAKCIPGCTCGRHKHSHSEETRVKLSKAHLARRHLTSERVTRQWANPEIRAKMLEDRDWRDVSQETRSLLSALRKGKTLSEATRAKIAEKIRPIAWFSLTGGQTAVDFARVLCPAGFVREHYVQWGKGNERFRLDFAHLEGKVCIELDGASHANTQEYDSMRDSLLRAIGWRVIRIKV